MTKEELAKEYIKSMNYVQDLINNFKNTTSDEKIKEYINGQRVEYDKLRHYLKEHLDMEQKRRDIDRYNERIMLSQADHRTDK